jgi:dTDP-4-amino-4,6-dideoxygalactose transaminase
LAILSFHPVKTVTTGEGGAVLTNSDELARRARAYANHGLERNAKLFAAWDLPEQDAAAAEAPWLYQQQLLGFNYRITDLQCALGRSQLRRLASFKARRREIAARYTEVFSGLPGLRCPATTPEADPCYHLYVLRLSGGSRVRLALYTALRGAGIIAQVHYIPVHLQPWYREHAGTSTGDFPVAEGAYSSCISLPLFPAMRDDEVERVIAVVRDFMAGRA